MKGSPMTIFAETLPTPPAQGDLLRRIAFTCRAVRAFCLVCAVWIVGGAGWHWSQPARVAEQAKMQWGLEGAIFSQGQLAAGLAADLLLPGAAGLGALYCLWRLFGGFLAGRIFAVESAHWLRRAGLFLLAGALASVLGNMAQALILSLHLGEGHRLLAIGLPPVFFLGLLTGTAATAMAQVFLAAAELADDHAQIV
jgi:hypothetical protein